MKKSWFSGWWWVRCFVLLKWKCCHLYRLEYSTLFSQVTYAFKYSRDRIHSGWLMYSVHYLPVATACQFIHSNCRQLIRQGVRQQIEFDVYLALAIILFFSVFLGFALIFGLSRHFVFARPFTVLILCVFSHHRWLCSCSNQARYCFVSRKQNKLFEYCCYCKFIGGDANNIIFAVSACRYLSLSLFL